MVILYSNGDGLSILIASGIYEQLPRAALASQQETRRHLKNLTCATNTSTKPTDTTRLKNINLHQTLE